LKARFLDEDNPNYLLKTKYHKGIPADGFSVFAESIWEKICHNRDLDLPTQQQLLAQFRCDEIAKSVYESFLKSVEKLKSGLGKGKVYLEFGSEASKSVESSLELFDKDAIRYHSETYREKRIEFSGRLYTCLHVLFLQQMHNLLKESLELFPKKLNVNSIFNTRKSRMKAHLKKE
jgi:hypothetical protein